MPVRSWHEVSGNLPSDFGFPIAVHAHEPETIYVVPIKSDSEHFPPDGKLRVYRSRTGGNEWEALTKGLAAKRLLRQRPAQRPGGRHARSLRDLLRHHRRAGVRLADSGDTWTSIVQRSARSAFGRSPDTAMIRVVLPTHLWRLANTEREIELEVAGPITLEATLDVLEARYPMLRGTIRDHVTKERRPFMRFFACGEDWSLEPPDTLLPEAVVTGAQPLRIVGAMAGG